MRSCPVSQLQGGLIKTMSHGWKLWEKLIREAWIEIILSHNLFPRSRMNFSPNINDVFSKWKAGRQVGFLTAHLQPLNPRLAAACVCVCVIMQIWPSYGAPTDQPPSRRGSNQILKETEEKEYQLNISLLTSFLTHFAPPLPSPIPHLHTYTHTHTHTISNNKNQTRTN